MVLTVGRPDPLGTLNAINNDAALRGLATYFDAEDIEFGPISSRIQCFGHIITLVVKDFLWGTNSEAFEKGIEVHDGDAEDQLRKNLLHWRKRGVLGSSDLNCPGRHPPSWTVIGPLQNMFR